MEFVDDRMLLGNVGPLGKIKRYEWFQEGRAMRCEMPHVLNKWPNAASEEVCLLDAMESWTGLQIVDPVTQ